MYGREEFLTEIKKWILWREGEKYDTLKKIDM